MISQKENGNKSKPTRNKQIPQGEGYSNGKAGHNGIGTYSVISEVEDEYSFSSKEQFSYKYEKNEGSKGNNKF